MANKTTTNQDEIVDRMARAELDGNTLAWAAHEGSKTPDEIIMEAERAAALEEQREFIQEMSNEIRSQVVTTLLAYLLKDFHKRPSAIDVGKRVIAMAKFIDHRAIRDHSASALARACGETPGAMTDRITKECNELVAAMGGKARARFQQSDAQKSVSAAAQKGNQNGARKKRKLSLADIKKKKSN